MSMKYIQSKIPTAVQAIENAGILLPGTNNYPKAFKGYFASFAASVIQAGFEPTIIFFADPNASSESDRYRLILALYLMERQSEGTFNDAFKESIPQETVNMTDEDKAINKQRWKELASEALQDLRAKSAQSNRILNNAIALKLALRLYNPVKTN